MNIFRPVVKYGFVIAVVIGISLSYVNRYEWFPQIFKQARQDTGALPVTEEASTPSQPTQPSGETQVASPDESRPEPIPATESGSSTAEVTTPVQSAVSGTPSETVQPSGVQEVPQSNESSVAQEPKPAQQAMAPAIPSTSGPQAGVQEPIAPNEPAQAVDQYMELVMDARMAFWQGKYEEATGKYQEAMKLMPDNPDAYGELGNLYYSQGKWEQAGDAYYQAAQHLLDSGDIDQAAQLSNVVQGLAPERAQELQKRIQSVVEQGSSK